MQVKQRLRINLVISCCSLCAIIVVLALTAHRVNAALEASRLADAILTASFERLLLRTDLHRTGSERAQTQLIAKHAEVGRLLKLAQARFPDPADQKTLAELLVVHHSTGNLSKAIRTNMAKRGFAPPDPVSRQMEERLLSQLNTRVYETILLDSRLQASGARAVRDTVTRGGVEISLVLLLVSVLTLGNSLIMDRTIAQRIRLLRDGTKAVGTGELGHRLDIAGDDEFAELACSFDEMTRRLRESHQVLQREIAGHERTGNELREKAADLRVSNEDLSRLNRAMVGRELRMVQLKQEVNELRLQAGLPPRYGLEAEEFPRES